MELLGLVNCGMKVVSVTDMISDCDVGFIFSFWPQTLFSIDFPIGSKDDVSFHGTAFDYSRADGS